MEGGFLTRLAGLLLVIIDVLRFCDFHNAAFESPQRHGHDVLR